MSKKKLESTRYGTWSNKNVLKIIFFQRISHPTTLMVAWQNWVGGTQPASAEPRDEEEKTTGQSPSSFIHQFWWLVNNAFFIPLYLGRKKASQKKSARHGKAAWPGKTYEHTHSYTVHCGQFYDLINLFSIGERCMLRFIFFGGTVDWLGGDGDKVEMFVMS